ncbi:hypothetical protein FOL47_003833 [Perkinsus chesapeaki]|uniref:RING-type domain-containing protein n=1 Tax=Perkinsus chesapeaki TaxID=330153 RepID=A0A7J6M5X0_PERCH|nr:hypothetical protein FOL47_003833 [Perkinsus chesapeaki]
MADSYYDSDLVCEYCSINFDLEHHVPKLLGVCGHNLCAECVASLGQARGIGRFMCPFCRQPHRPGEISTNPVIIGVLRSAASGVLGSSPSNGLNGSSSTDGGATCLTASDDEDARSDTFDEDASWNYKWYEEKGKWWFFDPSKDRRWHYFGKWTGSGGGPEGATTDWKDWDEWKQWKDDSGQQQQPWGGSSSSWACRQQAARSLPMGIYARPTCQVQVRKQLRSTIRGTSTVEGTGKQQRAKGGECGSRRASTAAPGGVRSPRTLVAVAKSLASASAGKVPSPAELFKLSGKQEASARQSAAQAQLRSGPARASRRRSTVSGVTGEKAAAGLVVEVPKRSVAQRQRRERELEQAAQARQFKQAVLAERNLAPPPPSRTHPSHRPPGDGQQQQQQTARQHRPSLLATSRTTLTQVYGGKGRGQSSGRRSRPRSSQPRQGCSRSLPPLKGRSTPPNSANRRPDGRCTPYSEGCASPRNDMEGIPPPPAVAAGKRWQQQQPLRSWSPERARVVRAKGRPPLRKRLRRATLAKAAACLRRTLASTRSQTVLQEEERRDLTQEAGSQTGRTGSSPSTSAANSSEPALACEELSPLVTSISLSTSRMKGEKTRTERRTVATNTSPPRRRPPRASSIGQEEQHQPQPPAYSEVVSNSLRDAARAHGLTITNLGGLRDSSIQQNSTTSPLHWSRASEEFLGTFCSAHGLTLVNMAHSFPSPSSPDTSLPPANAHPSTFAAPSGWQNSQERPLRYPRPEPAADTANPQDLVLVDRTAASMTTPGQGEEMSDYLEGCFRGASMAAQRSPPPLSQPASKPVSRSRALPQRYAFDGPGRSRVESSTASLPPPSDGGGGVMSFDDGMVNEVNDGMRIIDIVVAQMRSTTMEQDSPAGIRTVSVPVQANLDQSSVPEAQHNHYHHHPHQHSTALSGAGGDSGGLMLVDFNTQRRPPIRMTGNATAAASAALQHRQGASSSSTASETSDILPESLYDSIGVISHLSDANDATEKQQGEVSRMGRRGHANFDCDLLLEDICTKAEPVYSTSGSSSSLAGTATPSIPSSGAASPAETGQWKLGAWSAAAGGGGPHLAQELTEQARLALDHMDRTDELMRLADVAGIQRQQQLLVRQQVADAVTAGRRHSDRLARAQQLCETMQANSSSSCARLAPPPPPPPVDKRPELRERSTEICQSIGRAVGVETAPTAMEAVGLQTESIDRRTEMEANLEHSLCEEDKGEEAKPFRSVHWQTPHHGGYAMWTQTEGPIRGVDQAVQPTPSASSCRSNERWSVATSRGGGGADSARRAVGVCCSSSPSYSMVGFEEDGEHEITVSCSSEVSMVHPGSIVASSFHSDISLPFTAPYSDWRSSAAGGGGGGQQLGRDGDEDEASILSASAALEGHLNLTYRSLRNDRSVQASPGGHDVVGLSRWVRRMLPPPPQTLRSSHTSLCESRLSQSPSCSSSMVTDISFDGGRHSVEEVTGALARRRKRAVEDVEKRIRDSQEKMAAGKEKDIPSPVKKRRERRELRRRQREESRSRGSLRDSRESTGSSTDSLSIIIRDAERRLLHQQQRLRSRGEAVAKATEDAIRDNEAKLKRVEYLKELKKEIAVARQQEMSPPPVEVSKEKSGQSSPAAAAVKEVGGEVAAGEVGVEEVDLEGDGVGEVVEEAGGKELHIDPQLSPRIETDEEAMASSSSSDDDDERKSTGSSVMQRIHAVEVHNEEDSMSSTKLLEVVHSRSSPETAPALSPGTGGLSRVHEEEEVGILEEEEVSQTSLDSAVLIADPVEAAKAVAEAKAPSLRKDAGGGSKSSGASAGGHQFEASTGPVIEVARFEAKSPVVAKESSEDLEIDKMEVVEEAPVQSPELITMLPRQQQQQLPAATSGSSKTSPAIRIDGDRMIDSASPSAGTRALLGWVRALPKRDLDECVNHITEHVLESLLDDRALERKVLTSLGGSSSHPIEEGGGRSEESTRKLHADRLIDLKAQAAAVVEAASLRYATTESVGRAEVNGNVVAEIVSKEVTSPIHSELLWDSCLELARRPSPEQQACSLWCKRFPGAKSPLSPFIAVTNAWSTIHQQLNRILETNSDLRMRAEAGLYHSELQQAEEQQVDNLARQVVSHMAIAGVTSLFDRSERKLIRSRILDDLDEAVFAALVEDFALELRDEYEEGGG